MACRMLRGQVDRGAFPPNDDLQLIALATSLPQDHGAAITQWTADELAARIINDAHHRTMSRSTVSRHLRELDLKPHRSVYWLNSHDPDFLQKAQLICRLYLSAPQLSQHGRLLICSDEKSGMQILERAAPTQPAQPGKPIKREHNYIRHGTRVALSSLVVTTGRVICDLQRTRTNVDFVQHVEHVYHTCPAQLGYDWIVDNLNIHSSFELCQWVARISDVPCDKDQLATGPARRAFLSDPTHKVVFHYLPIHGSWLNQIELWFAVLVKQFLAQGNFASDTAFEAAFWKYLDHANHHAHPYRWTYTGQPLVRNTPGNRTRRQAQHGRTNFSPRSYPYERILYPPRPYRKQPPKQPQDQPLRNDL
jgi:hypothetical protein